MEEKRTLLAHLTLWQEAARNAQKENMGRVVFEPKEMERVCGQLRAYIESETLCAREIIERVIEVLNGNLKYGSMDEWLTQDVEFCVSSLEGLL